MGLFRQNYGAVCLHHYRRAHSSTTRAIPKENLPAAAYQPRIVKDGKYKQWEDESIFTADNCSEKPTFSMVLPPPNVTGKLHLGHALTCTIQDVIVRRKRALGHNVLWLPGTDHAGIATQGVVEKYLKTTQNIDRHSFGRDKFNKEVWKWREKYGNTILTQLRTLACSLDWSREYFTMDPKHTNAVNFAFMKLFEKGLIYRKKALVNWCNALKSTVSDIEVDNIVLEAPKDIPIHGYCKPVKFGQLYNFAYKIFGSNEEIVVSTTMPETMLGDVAVAVHPDDERYSHLVSKRVYHPFRNRTIPIIFDKFVDMKFGTGAVKITPAHSKVDYEVAQTHRLPLLQVYDEDGLIMQNTDFNTNIFNGLKRYECRDVLVKKLNELGLLKDVVAHKMNLPTCSRTGDVIEYLPKEQWFLSCSELNKKAIQLVESGILEIEPATFVTNWLNWTGNDRDWCISRQLWWGHQIPAYKCSDRNNDIVWIAALDELAAKNEAAKYLRASPDEIVTIKDSDVLDTWFSSGIYPFAALGWPDSCNPDWEKFYPLNLMVTGHDILGFWVHRMVILGMELTGDIPFNKVLLHGIVCDNRGVKMSKSKGNVIDPIDVIEGISVEKLKEKSTDMFKNGVLTKEELKKAIAYHKTNFGNTDGIPECGVDALRFTLLSQDIKSHFVNFDVSYCRANKLFCNKIWQSINYLNLCHTKLKATKDEITVDDLTFFDKWILSKLASMVENVNRHMEGNDFHLATKALKTFIYNEMCDFYLEATKSGFNDENSKVGYAHTHTLAAILNTSLRCLHPIMVHITEEVIPKIRDFEKNIICNYYDLTNDFFDFPQSKCFDVWKDVDLEDRVQRLLDTMSLIREIKGQYGVSNKVRPCIHIKSTDHILAASLKEHANFVLYMTKCGRIHFGDTADNSYVKGYLDKNTEVFVEVIGDDIANAIIAARARLLVKINKLEESLGQLEETFSNERYVTTVPESRQVLDKEKFMSKKQELSQLKKLME